MRAFGRRSVCLSGRGPGFRRFGRNLGGSRYELVEIDDA